MSATLTHPEILASENFDQMVLAMLNTEQTEGQSVYQHGMSVCNHLFALVEHLRGGSLDQDHWRLPKWFVEHGRSLLTKLWPDDKVRLYAIYHDCGKPFCRVIDEEGRRHFPNHAEVSARVWASVGGDPVVGRLIRDDMVIHTASADEIDLKLHEDWSHEDAATLLLASLSEVHSNAKMFGGLQSTSFKVKLKTVERRGGQICRHVFG